MRKVGLNYLTLSHKCFESVWRLLDKTTNTSVPSLTLFWKSLKTTTLLLGLISMHKWLIIRSQFWKREGVSPSHVFRSGSCSLLLVWCKLISLWQRFTWFHLGSAPCLHVSSILPLAGHLRGVLAWGREGQELGTLYSRVSEQTNKELMSPVVLSHGLLYQFQIT